MGLGVAGMEAQNQRESGWKHNTHLQHTINLQTLSPRNRLPTHTSCRRMHETNTGHRRPFLSLSLNMFHKTWISAWDAWTLSEAMAFLTSPAASEQGRRAGQGASKPSSASSTGRLKLNRSWSTAPGEHILQSAPTSDMAGGRRCINPSLRSDRCENRQCLRMPLADIEFVSPIYGL